MTGSVTFMLEETNDHKKRALAGSWSFSGAVVGCPDGIGRGRDHHGSPYRRSGCCLGLAFAVPGRRIAVFGFLMRRGLVHEAVPDHPGHHAIPLLDADERKTIFYAVGSAAFNGSAF